MRMYKLFVATMVVVCTGCPSTPSPIPPPQPDADAAPVVVIPPSPFAEAATPPTPIPPAPVKDVYGCRDACDNLASLGFNLDNCEAVCLHVETTPGMADLKLDCLKAATTQEEACACGSIRCSPLDAGAAHKKK